jgi:glycosyltransferase involved in cell wall biosynthesis
LETAKQVQQVLQDLIKKNKVSPESFIYFVNDGSRDSTWRLILELHAKDQQFKGLSLSRNFGHQNALLAGLLTLKDKADCFISLDADLQDDITIMDQFIEQFRSGYDIVYGVRKNRDQDTLLKRYPALIFYSLMKLMGVNSIYNHADYRLVSKKVLQVLADFKEANIFLRGIFPSIGFKTTCIYYARSKRIGGTHKYTFRKLLILAWDGITSFSIVPLRAVTIIGGLTFIFSMAMIISVLSKKFITGQVVVGWTSTVLAIYLLGSVQIMCLGLIGEYIGKMYQEVKARPRFIPEQELF